MGKMEEGSRKRSRNQTIQSLILGSVAIAGVLAVGLVAPNVVGAMEKIGLIPKKRQEEYIRAARRRLKQQGFLAERDGFLRITTKGQRAMGRTALAFARPNRLKKWDGKWRILIFDIAEKRKGLRSRVREQLRAAGFVRMQNSVWIYPYPCEEYVALLKAEMRIGRDLLYLIVDSLEGDDLMRNAFKLPPPADAPAPPVKLPKLIDTVLSAVLPLPDNSLRPA